MCRAAPFRPAPRERTGQVEIAALIRSRLRQGFEREHPTAWDAICVRRVTPAEYPWRNRLRKGFRYP